MPTEPTDREALESRWHRNEADLNRLNSMSGIGRESFGARIDELESDQDAIEFELGRDTSAPGDSCRWSGMP
jgi:hypothetical protein